MTQPKQESDLSYASRGNLWKRWTSLGVVAITLAGIATTLSVLIILGYTGIVPFPFRSSLFRFVALTVLAASMLSTILGLITLLTGTAELESRKDLTLGVISLIASIINAAFAALFVAYLDYYKPW